MQRLEDFCNYFGKIDFVNEHYELRRNAIYMILGFECNLRCKYCFNTHNFKNKVAKEPSQDFIEFLKYRLPRALGSRRRLIQFWGGEPLLYWDVIKLFVEELKNIPNYTMLVVTNGELLTEEIVNYANANKLVIGVSHDGLYNNYYREYDALRNKSMLINKIENFAGISAVLTPKDCSFYSINHFFQNNPLLDENHKTVSIFPVIDAGLTDGVSLFTDKFEAHMYEYVENMQQKLMNREYSEEFQNLNNGICAYFMFKRYPSLCKDLFFKMFLNVDVQGNLYYNHGGNFHLGDIHTPLAEIRERFISIHNTHIGRWEECLKCEVFPICQGGQLIGISKDSNNFCNMYRRFTRPLLRMLEKEL